MYTLFHLILRAVSLDRYYVLPQIHRRKLSVERFSKFLTMSNGKAES